jgi:hypothetical protein
LDLLDIETAFLTAFASKVLSVSLMFGDFGISRRDKM